MRIPDGPGRAGGGSIGSWWDAAEKHVTTNLFIDTNVFLSFYHLTGEDLEELKKLSALIEKGKVLLLVPQQVVQEFERNRDGKIADALRHLRDQKLGFKFPQLSKEYGEYQSLRDLQKSYEKTHAKLLEKIQADVDARNLAADHLVKKLFNLGQAIETTDELVKRARLRVDLGNPPGKKGSLGDAINWEALLSAELSSEDLHFVTEDRDYFSTLNPDDFNSYLKEEWCNKGFLPDLVVYRKLSGFFKTTFPEIKLASEIDKDLLIAQLTSSGSFAQTHSVVSRLNDFSDFTVYQAEAILAAATSNNQVAWIVDDADVKAFIKSVVNGKESKLNPELLGKVMNQLSSEETDDTVPF